MKFTLAKSSAIWWPVTVSMPDPENPGKTVKSTLKVLIQPVDQDEFLAAQEEIAAIKGARAQAAADRAYLAGYICDWDWPDMLGEDQRPISYSDQNVAAALQKAWFRTGLWTAINEISLGQEARLGN